MCKRVQRDRDDRDSGLRILEQTCAACTHKPEASTEPQYASSSSGLTYKQLVTAAPCTHICTDEHSSKAHKQQSRGRENSEELPVIAMQREQVLTLSGQFSTVRFTAMGNSHSKPD